MLNENDIAMLAEAVIAAAKSPLTGMQGVELCNKCMPILQREQVLIQKGDTNRIVPLKLTPDMEAAMCRITVKGTCENEFVNLSKSELASLWRAALEAC